MAYGIDYYNSIDFIIIIWYYISKLAESEGITNMNRLKELSKYIGLFIFAVAVIAVYKTFDNIGYILGYGAYILSVLSPFFIGFVIAYVLLQPCRFIEKLLAKSPHPFLVRHRRAIAAAAIYIIFFAVIILALVAIIPSIISSLTDFYNQLPTLVGDFVNWFNSLNLGITLGDDTIQKIFENEYFSVQKLMTYFSFDNVNRYAQGVITVGSNVFKAFMGIIISVYILIDRTNLKASAIRLSRSLISPKPRAFLARYARMVNEFANKYIYCMLVDAIIIFIASFIILSVEGVKYAPLLALMTGLFNLIPYFGAIIATAITGVITGFTGSLTLAIISVISLIVLQQLDSNFIQPKLLSGSLQIKPFWVIFGALLGSGLFGILGFFLAIPLTALCRNMLIDFMQYRENKTEEQSSAEPAKTADKNK